MTNLDEVNRLLAEAEAELVRLNARRDELLAQLAELQREKTSVLHGAEAPSQFQTPSVTNQSPPEAKIALFRSLFRGREDVYARRFESRKTGKEVTARAHKRLLALQLSEAMEQSRITKTQLAERLQTSRSQLDRLLDPDNTAVTLDSLERLAHAVGRELKVELA
jgi:antitoxin HicB